MSAFSKLLNNHMNEGDVPNHDMQRLESEVTRLKKVTKHQEGQISRLVSQNQDLVSQNKDLKEQQEDLEKREMDQKEEEEKLEQWKVKIRGILESAKQEMAALKEQHEEDIKKIEEERQYAKKMEEQLKKTTRRAKRLENSLRKAEGRIEQLESVIQSSEKARSSNNTYIGKKYEDEMLFAEENSQGNDVTPLGYMKIENEIYGRSSTKRYRKQILQRQKQEQDLPHRDAAISKRRYKEEIEESESSENNQMQKTLELLMEKITLMEEKQNKIIYDMGSDYGDYKETQKMKKESKIRSSFEQQVEDLDLFS